MSTCVQDGVVIACDVSEEFTNIGKPFWAEAGVAEKIKLKIAPAAQTLKNIIENGEGETFDFAFIDADKTGYDEYFELCLPLLRKGGILAFDNTLRQGTVVDPEGGNPDTVATRELNKKLASDPRVVTVQINIGDGYTLVTKI